MRLFIALPLPDEAVSAIVSLQEEMRKAGITGSYTARSNLHLTLAFIGESDQAKKTAEILKEIPFDPSELTIREAGHFGSLYYLALRESDGEERLADYVSLLREKLMENGIHVDGKKFVPHITILRKGKLPADSEISVHPIKFLSPRPVLFSSAQENGKRVYRNLTASE